MLEKKERKKVISEEGKRGMQRSVQSRQERKGKEKKRKRGRR